MNLVQVGLVTVGISAASAAVAGAVAPIRARRVLVGLLTLRPDRPDLPPFGDLAVAAQ
jgi:hypothetical protein